MESKFDTIGVKDFFNKFKRSDKYPIKELNPTSRFHKVDQKTYEKIFRKFFRIYTNEVFFLNNQLYFILGGKLKKVRCGNKVFEDKNVKKTKYIKYAVGLNWYLRPCKRFLYSIRFRKQKGKANYVPQVEREWERLNDVSALPFVNKVLIENGERKIDFVRRKQIK